MANRGIERTGGDEPSLLVYARRERQLVLGLVCAGLTTLGMWMVSTVDLGLMILGVLLVAGFGSLSVLFVRVLLRPGPALVVDRRGITDHTSAASSGLVGWDQVTGLGIWVSGGRRSATVIVRDPEALMEGAFWLSRPLLRMNRQLTGTPVSIPGRLLPVPADELVAEIATVSRQLDE